MDPRMKKKLMQETIYHCRYGVYTKLPMATTNKLFYNDNFPIPPVYIYCDVDVVKTHPIDAAYEYIKKGCKPVIIINVDEDFAGNNIENSEGIKDPLMNIRTNFCKMINTTYLSSHNLLPITGPEILFSPSGYIIRGPNMNFLNPAHVLKTPIITAPLRNTKDIEYKRNIMMNRNRNTNNNTNNTNPITFDVDTYNFMNNVIETIFQTAAIAKADTIILNDLGCKTDGYPVEYIANIINGCIYKYGHLFKNVVIALNVQSSVDMGYDSKFKELLVRPQKYIIEYIQEEQHMLNTTYDNDFENEKQDKQNEKPNDKTDKLDELQQLQQLQQMYQMH